MAELDIKSKSSTVTGTVTANAGINLNTSLLALEAGGNLATIAGDTTSIDGKITDGTQQTKIKETIPTDATKNNGSFVYIYDVSGNLTQIDQTIGAATYRKTLTYDGSNNLTAMSVWTVV